MSTPNDLGEVRSERAGHVLTITVDRSGKMNGFTPEMFDALSDAMTLLDEDPDLWAGVLTFAGPHTTAGLDLPRFAAAFSSEGGSAAPDPRVDAFALRRNCRKPVVMAVQGITFTIGIEMMLAADIVVAADDCRFCQMEPKRGLAVFGGAHVRYVERAGWGNAMYHLLRADEFGAARALQIGFVQEVVPAGAAGSARAGDRRRDLHARAVGRAGDQARRAGVSRTRRASGLRRDSGDARGHGTLEGFCGRVWPRSAKNARLDSRDADIYFFERRLNQMAGVAV